MTGEEEKLDQKEEDNLRGSKEKWLKNNNHNNPRNLMMTGEGLDLRGQVR
jgi:hypothetical protein